MRPKSTRACAPRAGYVEAPDGSPAPPLSPSSGSVGSLSSAVGVTEGYYLFYAAPYVLTLGVLIATSSPRQAMAGAPGELSITK